MPSIILDLEKQGSNASESGAKKTIGPGDGRDAKHALANRLELPLQAVACGITPSWPGAGPRDALWPETPEEPDAWQWHRDIPGSAAHRGSEHGGHSPLPAQWFRTAWR